MTVDHLLIAAAADQPVRYIKKNTIALWRSASGTNFNAAINPTSYLSTVRFHSALDYLRVASIVKSTDAGRSPVTLPARGEGTVINQSNTLFAHGLDYTPLMICDITVNGYSYSCNGSSMVLPGGASNDPRWIGFTSDATNIYMRAVGWMGAACTVHWRVHVLAEQFQETSEADDLLVFSPEEVIAPKIGKIDSDHRYVRKVDSGGDFRFVGKQTLKFDVQNTVIAVNFSDGVTDAAAAGVYNTPFPVGHYHTTKFECKV